MDDLPDDEESSKEAAYWRRLTKQRHEELRDVQRFLQERPITIMLSSRHRAIREAKNVLRAAGDDLDYGDRLETCPEPSRLWASVLAHAAHVMRKVIAEECPELADEIPQPGQDRGYRSR